VGDHIVPSSLALIASTIVAFHPRSIDPFRAVIVPSAVTSIPSVFGRSHRRSHSGHPRCHGCHRQSHRCDPRCQRCDRRCQFGIGGANVVIGAVILRSAMGRCPQMRATRGSQKHRYRQLCARLMFLDPGSFFVCLPWQLRSAAARSEQEMSIMIRSVRESDSCQKAHVRGWPANSSQKLSRPGAGPAAELPSQHTRMGGVTAVANRQSWLRNSSPATAVPRRLRHVGPGRAA
jgi:hypothetical protein